MREITSLLMAVLTAITASAMPAIQTPIEVSQPDGNAIMRTEAEYYVYALSDNENLMPSKVIVRNEDEHSSIEMLFVSALEKDLFSKVDTQNGFGAEQTSDTFSVGANLITNTSTPILKTWKGNPNHYYTTSIHENNNIITFNLDDITQHTYSVAGSPAVLFGTENEWDMINGPEMTLNDDTGIYEWTSEEIELSAGLIAFKVFLDHNWRIAYPPEDFEITAETPGTYTLYVTYNPETNEVTGELVQKHTYALAGTPAALFGVENDWDIINGPEMTLNEETSLYEWTSAEIELSAGLVAFKVFHDHNWRIAYPPEDFEITAETPGTYTLYVTYNPETSEVCGTLTKSANGFPGDVNGDGIVTAADITTLYDILLNNDYSHAAYGDQTGDGIVTAADVTAVYNILLLDSSQASNQAYVDLGLPSGTLWATMNIGASSPEDYGDHFAWGETQPKDVYNWSTYKWGNGSSSKMTKYCTDSSFGNNGFVDNKTELDPEDDAATANWGPEWRTPTKEQEDELRNECIWQWTTQNGVNGYQVTSKHNSASLFLPAAGTRNGNDLSNAGARGTYWSRTLYNDIPRNANYLYFFSDAVRWEYYGRQYGFSVRAVRAPQPSNHAYVDLGLPSGTLWATMNIGASSPEDYGDYFAWGETQPKDVYSWSTYKWCNGSSSKMTKYCTDSSFGNNGFVDNKTELDPEDDAATANWGPEWRTPTKEQEDELRNECIWQWTTQNGVNGYQVTSKHNGASLFLPAAGTRSGNDLSNASASGTYWSRMLYNDSPRDANYLYFNSGAVRWEYYGRRYGFTVRAVRAPQK